jgi:hypothetical protein
LVGYDASMEDAIFSQAVELLDSGKVTLNDLAKILAGKEEFDQTPVKLPLPASITLTEIDALSEITTKYGRVIPTEVRQLKEDEVEEIFTERSTLETIKKMVANREADIRTTLLNHFDVKNVHRVNESTPRDKDGHFILESAEPIPNTRQKFTWEVRPGTPTISVAELKKMAQDPEDCRISWADYLSMTKVPEPERTFSEDKALEALKKSPKLLEAIAAAAVPAKVTGAFFVRNQK